MRKALEILGILNDHDTEWLMAHGEVRSFREGTTIIHEGEPIDSLCILLDGLLSVRRLGLERDVALLRSGEIVGEISFVDARPPSASVVAVETSQVFQIPSTSLRAKLDRDDGFAARFYRAVATYLADRLRTTTQRLGYGDWAAPPEADDLDEQMLDDMSLAARRFDEMLKRLRIQ